MDHRYGSHTVFQEEMIKEYVEYHFEPNPNDNFRMEPE